MALKIRLQKMRFMQFTKDPKRLVTHLRDKLKKNLPKQNDKARQL